MIALKYPMTALFAPVSIELSGNRAANDSASVRSSHIWTITPIAPPTTPSSIFHAARTSYTPLSISRSNDILCQLSCFSQSVWTEIRCAELCELKQAESVTPPLPHSHPAGPTLLYFTKLYRCRTESKGTVPNEVAAMIHPPTWIS